MLPDGGRRFLGGTRGAAFHVPGLSREQGEPALVPEVRAVDELFAVSEPSSVRHPW
ncbi:hypothetical protein [Streptomyces sp. x-80]|uniref:hypothetical protein n=1 Tax=Streptomyces sp. x-80 TaxID=2789282 RepID=UPI00398037CC